MASFFHPKHHTAQLLSNYDTIQFLEKAQSKVDPVLVCFGNIFMMDYIRP